MRLNQWKMCSRSSLYRCYVYFSLASVWISLKVSPPQQLGPGNPRSKIWQQGLWNTSPSRLLLPTTSLLPLYPSPLQSPVDPFSASSIRAFGFKERRAKLDFNYYQQAKLHRSNFGIFAVMSCFRTDFKVFSDQFQVCPFEKTTLSVLVVWGHYEPPDQLQCSLSDSERHFSKT